MTLTSATDAAAAARAAGVCVSASLHAAAQRELEDLWYDLSSAVRSAINGRWSIACDHLVARIVSLSLQVGATRWEAVPLDLLDSGIYEAVLDAVDVRYEPVDRCVVHELIQRQRCP